MKPQSLSVKNFLIRKLSVELQVPEKIVEIVVNNQFSTALEMMKTKNSVELSGFGKFMFNRKKAEKMMEKFLSQQNEFNRIIQDDPSRRRNAEMKLQAVIKNIETLKPKLDEH